MLRNGGKVLIAQGGTGNGRVNPADFERIPAEICVIAFSHDHSPEHDHYGIITRCLDSIIAHTRPGSYRLHIGCNNLSPRVLAYVDGLVASQAAVKYTGDAARDRNGKTVYPKYPLMRRMYQAISSPWSVWFDDDSYVVADDWLERLEQDINANPRAEQFGKQRGVLIPPELFNWIRRAGWYRPAVGLPQVMFEERMQVGFNFIVGGFYALSHRAIKACDIPDPRLFQDFGDWVTTLALLHQGMDFAEFSYGVKIDTEPRRGMHRNQWTAPDNPVLADKSWSEKEEGEG